MKTPHKHADLIKQWADGSEIEIWLNISRQWCYDRSPSWSENITYRIKPEPKPDTVNYHYAEKYGYVHTSHNSKSNLKLTFDGETGALKSSEIIK